MKQKELNLCRILCWQNSEYSAKKMQPAVKSEDYSVLCVIFLSNSRKRGNGVVAVLMLMTMISGIHSQKLSENR